MTSSSGTSSGSSSLLSAIDEKKQRRMQSNRESARRSRMRKQKLLNDLKLQVNELKHQNDRILAALNLTTKHYLGVETQNSVLSTQKMELTSRLHSLNEILHFLNGNFGTSHGVLLPCDGPQIADGFSNPWNSVCMNQPIIAASADMFQYY